MKKKKFNMLYQLVGSIFAFTVGWYLLNSLIFALIFAFIVLVFISYVSKLQRKDKMKYENIESAYNFVNMMNVQMLTTKSIYESYKMIENYVHVDFANIVNEDFQNQLNDISNEYGLNSFKLYIKTLLIYDTDGGDFTMMEKIPSSLCQKMKVYYTNMKNHKISKIFDISALYGLWICVLVFLKSALLDYYDMMLEEFMYQIIIFIILLLGSFMYLMSLSHLYKNNIRGL